MKKSKFATNPVAQKIKKEAKQREAERIIEGLELPFRPTSWQETYLRVKKNQETQPPNVFMLGILLGVVVTILLGHLFVVMPLLTNL